MMLEPSLRDPAATDARPPTEQQQRAERAERLLAAGQSLTSELELATVLQRILEAGRDLTGARYAALGVLDDDRTALSDFITLGLDQAERAAIGDPPVGHGILGFLIEHPVPLRIHDVSQHPRSYGFPVGHPPMKSFLGAPITIRDAAWGNLYLTDKEGGEDFDEHDVETITVLAQWAAVAIDNAKLFGEATDRRRSLERALQASRTSMEITTAIGADTDLTRVLELIVKRGRALVEADSLLIWLRRGDQLQIAASAGSASVPHGTLVPIDASTAGQALSGGQSMRIGDLRQLRIDPREYGMDEASTVLIVPLIHRGQRHGVLMAFDRLGATASFDDEDQRTLEAFAVSAATAVATARSVEEQRLQNSMAAAESERQRWARELHDETLQGMAALKLALTAALRAEPGQAHALVQGAVSQLDADIRGLRAIIADLRPAALDELGLEPALHALVDRVAEAGGLATSLDVNLGDVRLSPELETAAYRVVQEALTNVVKHAGAANVSVVAEVSRGLLKIRVADDGRGVGEEPGKGYGLIGMRERAELAQGTIEIGPRSGGGTNVALELPL